MLATMATVTTGLMSPNSYGLNAGECKRRQTDEFLERSLFALELRARCVLVNLWVFPKSNTSSPLL